MIESVEYTASVHFGRTGRLRVFVLAGAGWRRGSRFVGEDPAVARKRCPLWIAATLIIELVGIIRVR